MITNQIPACVFHIYFARPNDISPIQLNTLLLLAKDRWVYIYICYINGRWHDNYNDINMSANVVDVFAICYAWVYGQFTYLNWNFVIDCFNWSND
jgi:hypothetical protein